jgi:hypothetical protein
MHHYVCDIMAANTYLLCRRVGCIADLYGVNQCDHCHHNYIRRATHLGMRWEARLMKNLRSFIFASCCVAAACAGLLTYANRHAVAQAIGQSLFGQMQTGAPLGPAISPQTEPLTGIYFGTGRTGVSRHFETGNTNANNLPVISACGAGATVNAGSTDMGGTYTTGAATTTCTLTFGTAYATAPACIVAPQGAATFPTYTTTTTTIAVTVDIAATTYAYFCLARQGG